MATERMQEMQASAASVEGSSESQTLRTHLKFADTLCGLGKLAEAEQVYKVALQTHAAKLGATHPETLRCAFEFAAMLHEQGRLAQVRGAGAGAVVAGFRGYRAGAAYQTCLSA